MLRFRTTLLAAAACSVLCGQMPQFQVQAFGENTTFREAPFIERTEGGQIYRTNDKAKTQRTWGMRVAVGLDDKAHWNLELAGRARMRSVFQYVGSVTPTQTFDNRAASLEYGWWGPGFSYAFDVASILRFNLGADFRVERITTFTTRYYPTETSVYNRPWARGSVAIVIPTSWAVRPLVGAEFGMALIRKNFKEPPAGQPLNFEDVRRQAAPDASGNVFVGVRF